MKTERKRQCVGVNKYQKGEERRRNEVKTERKSNALVLINIRKGKKEEEMK